MIVVMTFEVTVLVAPTVAGKLTVVVVVCCTSRQVQTRATWTANFDSKLLYLAGRLLALDVVDAVFDFELDALGMLELLVIVFWVVVAAFVDAGMGVAGVVDLLYRSRLLLLYTDRVKVAVTVLMTVSMEVAVVKSVSVEAVTVVESVSVDAVTVTVLVVVDRIDVVVQVNVSAVTVENSSSTNVM